MISTVIIQVCNQRKQMASVCYHSFYRRQRLRSRWCWLLVPSGCWMWLGKEWKTAKTTVSCIAKVTARAFHHALEVLKPERCKTAPNELGGEYKVKWDPPFLFPLCVFPNLYFQQRLPDCFFLFFFFSPVQHKTKGVRPLLGTTHIPLTTDLSVLPSTFLAVTFIDSRFDEISDSSLRHYPSESKFLLKWSSPCQGDKVHAPGSTELQPVSWNHTGWAQSWKGSHCKGWEFLPMVISVGQEANGREEAMACRALPLICSVWLQPRLRHTATPRLQRSRRSLTPAMGWPPQTQAPLHAWCAWLRSPPYSSSGPKLCTWRVKSLISLLRKYCKTLCFSCLISFRFLF